MRDAFLVFKKMGLFSFFTKEHKEDLDKGLEKTKEGFFSKITRAVAGKSKIDDYVARADQKEKLGPRNTGQQLIDAARESRCAGAMNIERSIFVDGA